MNAAAETTSYQIELLWHTLGLRVDRREPHRNHFAASDWHSDYADLRALEAAGLMTSQPLAVQWGGGVCFYATDDGRALALTSLPPPPKRTRYDEYLRADGCAGDSFGEFLCGCRLPEYETRRDLRRGGSYGLRTITEYRMFRRADRWTRDVQGEWCMTKKDAKASYKTALKARSIGAGASQ